MTKQELIDYIKDKLRVSSALPYSVPDREIENIISDSEKWFYDNYYGAVENKYYVIKKEDFQKIEFRSSRTILLPDCVVSVYEVREISGGGRLFTVDKDFADNRLIAAELYLSPFQSDGIVLRAAQYSYWDLSQSFFLDRIRYDFNKNTKKLVILGRNPSKDVLIQCFIKIPEENLYDDIYFLRYVSAMAKKSLGRILGFFTYNLVGGVTINSDALFSEGSEELEKVIEDIRNEDRPDYFFIFH